MVLADLVEGWLRRNHRRKRYSLSADCLFECAKLKTLMAESCILFLSRHSNTLPKPPDDILRPIRSKYMRYAWQINIQRPESIISPSLGDSDSRDVEVARLRTSISAICSKVRKPPFLCLSDNAFTKEIGWPLCFKNGLINHLYPKMREKIKKDKRLKKMPSHRR